MKIINSIIHLIGRKNYVIDKDINNIDLISILFKKSITLINGLFLRLWFKQSGLFIFIGKNSNISHKKLISLGNRVFIGDNVEINALSRFGVNIGDDVSILKNTIIECTGVLRSIGYGISIGNRVGIAQNCFIQVRGKVVIGNDIIMGPSVSIFSENHIFNDIKYINNAIV